MKKETYEIPEDVDLERFKGVIKPRSFIYKVWNDSVFSGLIVIGISILFPIIYSFIKSLLSGINFGIILRDIFTFNISLSVILIIILILYILWFIKKKWLKSFDHKTIDKILKTKIGDFNFSELHNTLLNHYVKNPLKWQNEGLESGHLLAYFLLFARYYNLGIPWDAMGAEGDFLYWKVGALLISYGLVYKETENKKDDQYDEMIYTSELGKKFYRLYQKYKYYLGEKYYDW